MMRCQIRQGFPGISCAFPRARQQAAEVTVGLFLFIRLLYGQDKLELVGFEGR